MNDRITLDMNPGEALFAYSAIQDAARAAYQGWNRAIQTDAPGDEQEIAKMRATTLGGLATRLEYLLYPPCEWMSDPDCDRPVVRGERYCAFHLERLAVTA